MMVGKLIGGHYQAILDLGTKGLVQTYLAQDTYRPGRPPCVVKHFLQSADDDGHSLQAARQMLIREAEVLKRLGSYSQIPQLLDFHEEHQEFYLVQEFIAGSPLSMELLPDSCWSESWVIQLLQEVLEILEFVHSHRIIHQDIKPDNLIRRKQDRQLVLIDFSSVKQLSDIGITDQEEDGNLIDATGQSHPNSDIYALGAIGIQAVTGLCLTQLPEDSDIGKILQQSQVQVSSELTFVLRKMVHQHFKDRYQSATEVLQALRPLANQHLPLQQETPLEPPLIGPEVSSQSLVTATQMPQALPSENASSAFATNPSSSLTGSQLGKASVSDLQEKSSLLIGIGMGVTTVTLGISLFYVLWLLAATPKDQKNSVSIPPWGEIAKARGTDEASFNQARSSLHRIATLTGIIGK